MTRSLIEKIGIVMTLVGALAGCAGTENPRVRIEGLIGSNHSLASQEDISRARSVMGRAKAYFSLSARKCLDKTDVMITYDKRVGGFYDSETNSIGFGSNSLDSLTISFHEGLHRLDDCGLIDREKFVKIYDNHEGEFKETIEGIISHPPYTNKHDLVSERIAYVGGFILNNSYPLPEELMSFYAPLLNGKKLNDRRNIASPPIQSYQGDLGMVGDPIDPSMLEN